MPRGRVGADPRQGFDGIEAHLGVLVFQFALHRPDRFLADLLEREGGLHAQIFVVDLEAGEQAFDFAGGGAVITLETAEIDAGGLAGWPGVVEGVDRQRQAGVL